MVRTSQATTLTFSTSPYFYDRGHHGTAQPITERINVRSLSVYTSLSLLNFRISLIQGRLCLTIFPKGLVLNTMGYIFLIHVELH
jgi:hypothetical protein